MHISFSLWSISTEVSGLMTTGMNDKGDEFILGVLLFLLAACYQDYRYGRIANRLVLAVLLWGLCVQLQSYGAAGMIFWLVGGVLVLALTYPLFGLGTLGAGDVKLFAACAGAMGIKRGILFLCCTFLVAAVLSLQKMLFRHNLLQRFRYFFTYIGQTIQTAQLLPYEKEDTIHLAGPAAFAVLLSLGGMY